MRIPTRRGEANHKSKDDGDIYLTPGAIARMKAELADLVKNQRKTLADEVRRTGEMGDLSENAAYQIAKHQLRRINSRILTLEDRLKRAIVIEEGSQDGVIRIGSTVTIKTNEREQTFEILGTHESNPARGRISYLSPIGSVLMGQKAGGFVTLLRDGKETVYEILSVH